tara:strand:- start:717 stop:977 length:261 start_codon:yes stop_codon:yes gene_type:complete
MMMQAARDANLPRTFKGKPFRKPAMKHTRAAGKSLAEGNYGVAQLAEEEIDKILALLGQTRREGNPFVDDLLDAVYKMYGEGKGRR